MRGWMRGCKPASKRASERVGLRVLLVLLLYYREGRKSCPSGVGFGLSGLGLNSGSGSASMYECAVVWEGQLRLSADVDGTSMTKDPRCTEDARGS